MEDLDKIIVHSLRQIGCELDEEDGEIGSLSRLSPELLVKAATTCISLIDPTLDVPKTLPANMAQRYNVTQRLSDACVSLGFRGDIGYQTFLYANTTEVRRVLMFLIERLPKEKELPAPVESLGPIARKEREIAHAIGQQLHAPWVPDVCKRSAFHKSDVPTFTEKFRSQRLSVPVTGCASTSYWNTSPTIFQQVEKSVLLPSLLHTNDKLIGGAVTTSTSAHSLKSIDASPRRERAPAKRGPVAAPRTKLPDDPETRLRNEIEQLKDDIERQEEANRDQALEQQRLAESGVAEGAKLTELEGAVVFKERLVFVLDDPETNVPKLKENITTIGEKLVALRRHWDEVSAPLLAQIDEAKMRLAGADVELKQQIKGLRERNEELLEEFRDRATLQATLAQQLQTIDRTATRKSYTSRILEIISSIRRQSIDIDRVLKDTRQLQKEINTLTGQLDRQFTATEDLIFRSAKQDEFSRRAYKLLVALHTDCDDLIRLVHDTGALIKENRDLEDQVDAERSKNVGEMLAQIEADVQRLQSERNEQ